MAENTLTPVRRGSLVLETLEQLKRVILSGALPEGAPLREVALAEKLGVSRVPIREALFELERQGLAVFEPSGRARVRSFTPRDVSEILSLRATLQAMAARQAALRMTDEGVKALEAILTKAAKTRDLTEFSALDTAFHDEVIRLADHRALARVWNDVRSQMELWLATMQRRRDRRRHDVRRETLRSHRKMIELLRSRRPDKAGAFMEHLCGSWEDMLPRELPSDAPIA
jgi:DNA-binding GntR family transcriptional regulator